MRKILAVALLSALAVLPGREAVAASLGLAHSEMPFSVVRVDKILPAMPRIPFTLRSGDQVRTGKSPVMVDGLKGETLLIGDDSFAEMLENQSVRLHGGGMAVSLPEGESLDLEVLDLKVEGLGSDADGAGSIAVAMASPDEINLMTDGRMVRVLSLDGAKQLATLGKNDVMRFVRDAASGDWLPDGPVSQFEGDPTSVEDGDSRRGGLIGFLRNNAGAGGAAASGTAAAAVAGGVVATGAVIGGGAAVGGFTQTDDDEEEEEVRQQTSPDQPPPQEPMFEEFRWPQEF